MSIFFNKKPRFYDYFPHLTITRMKTFFDLGYFEQGIVRDKIQKVIRSAFDHLVDAHDLRHANVYMEFGEEFDEAFYNELKTNCQKEIHDPRFWLFLDDLMPELGPDDGGALYYKLISIVGLGIPRENGNGRVKLREAFVVLFNFDLDALTGQELLYLTKIS